MRLSIKTVKNIAFDIQVKPEDKVSDVKKILEAIKHADIYPASEQKLIHHGNVLEDEKTLEEKNITEDTSVVMMHSTGWDGIPLIELFYMTYASHDVVMPEKQLGTIAMIVDDIEFDLYHEQNIDMNKPPIEFMDYIPVTGIGPIYSELKLEFDDLFCGSYKGCIDVSPENFRHGDGIIKRSIKSVNCNGEIDVIFGYFNNATVAILEVQRLNMSASTTINVYGVIASTNSHFEDFSSTSILFVQKPTDSIEVCSMEKEKEHIGAITLSNTEKEKEHVGVIPLSKSRVGVPLGSVMYVDISLSCGDKDYQGTACFDTFLNGTDSQVVADCFRVKVTWNCNEFPTTEEEYNSDNSDIIPSSETTYHGKNINPYVSYFALT
ncbi:uncharacterized protein LOC141693830 [Apium graveolens]|uniref:uncharacterized protein LOC141693830 n=1 Tax=Apium graveolens TaxID=4045 RepID=UPI003D79D225